MESSVTSSTTTIAAPVKKRQVTNKSEDVNVPVGYKRCSHCGKIKPLDEFYKDKNGKQEVKYCCKECWNKAQWQYQKSKAKKDKAVPDGYKRCSCCGEVKLLSEFNKDKFHKDGYQGQCRTCINAKRKERSEKKKSAQTETEAAQPKLPFDYARRIKRAEALSFAPDTKECNQCHRTLPMTEFQTCSSNADYIANTCKQCMSDNRKKARLIKKQKEECLGLK